MRNDDGVGCWKHCGRVGLEIVTARTICMGEGFKLGRNTRCRASDVVMSPTECLIVLIMKVSVCLTPQCHGLSLSQYFRFAGFPFLA